MSGHPEKGTGSAAAGTVTEPESPLDENDQFGTFEESHPSKQESHTSSPPVGHERIPKACAARPVDFGAFAEFGEPSDTDSPSLRSSLIASSDFLQLSIPRRDSLLGKWAREGDLGYLYAPRGHGKTWMAMLIGNAISNGIALGEWQAGENNRMVMYLDAEMNLADVQERARLIGIDNDNFTWLQNELIYDVLKRRLNITDPVDQLLITDVLEDKSVIIIDNLSTVSSGMAENDNDAFDLIKDWLLELRSRDITVIIVHHAGRNGEMRGASRREDMAHWILSLRDDTPEGGHGKAWVTQFKKCRNCPSHDAPPLRWTIITDSGRLTYGCSIHTGLEAMLALIGDGVESATLLAEELKVSKGCVSKWATKLKADKLIVIENGKYRLINKPE